MSFALGPPPGETERWFRRAQLRDVVALVGLPVSRAARVLAFWREELRPITKRPARERMAVGDLEFDRPGRGRRIGRREKRKRKRP